MPDRTPFEIQPHKCNKKNMAEYNDAKIFFLSLQIYLSKSKNSLPINCTFPRKSYAS